MYSVYNAYQEGETREESNPEWTNYTRKFKGTIDHILVNQKVTVHQLLNLPAIEDIIDEEALPSSKFPSDHVRISAILSFN